MTPRKPRAIGTAAETAVVRYLRTAGFPQAERRALTGVLDQGDITGTPGIAWEVKGGDQARTSSHGLISTWLAQAETERRNAAADVAILAVQRKGVGVDRAGMWWGIVTPLTLCGLWVPNGDPGAAHDVPVRLHLCDLVALLRAAGYGTPLTQESAS